MMVVKIGDDDNDDNRAKMVMMTIGNDGNYGNKVLIAMAGNG